MWEWKPNFWKKDKKTWIFQDLSKCKWKIFWSRFFFLSQFVRKQAEDSVESLLMPRTHPRTVFRRPICHCLSKWTKSACGSCNVCPYDTKKWKSRTCDAISRKGTSQKFCLRLKYLARKRYTFKGVVFRHEKISYRWIVTVLSNPK